MLNIRWKWIGYYTYSSLLTTFICLAVFWVTLNYLNITVPVNISAFVFLITVIASVICGLIFGFQFSKTLRNKLEEVTVGVKTLAYGNLSFRLPFTQDRDVGDIAVAFNEMADRIDEQVTTLQKLAEENVQLIQKTKTTAITEERQRLARDLHDAVSQQLFAIALTSATALRIIEKDPSKCSDLIRNIEYSATKAQAEMRALLLQLRPTVLQEERLVDAIRNLAHELEAKMAINCSLKLAEIALPNHIENQLYRIVQEALSNVLRHSEAEQVDIKLESLDNNKRAYLTIEDNGIGFDQSTISKTSYGIQTIKERVNEFGGTVKWISIPGKGTRLEVRIPIRKRFHNGKKNY